VKFVALVRTHLWNSSPVDTTQQNIHHLSIWCVLLLFHLNIWMKSLTQKDTSLLVSMFDTFWQAFYLPKLGLNMPFRLLFQLVIAFLEQRHAMCRLRGTLPIYCAKCSIDESGGDHFSDPHESGGQGLVGRVSLVAQEEPRLYCG
jgi:hypothetical protein